jgi:SepF-like predicted cell division protein (DUF552 family)
MREVLQRLRTYRLYAKRSKCSFYTNSVIFLGFVITPEGVKIERERVKTIDE